MTTIYHPNNRPIFYHSVDRKFNLGTRVSWVNQHKQTIYLNRVELVGKRRAKAKAEYMSILSVLGQISISETCDKMLAADLMNGEHRD